MPNAADLSFEASCEINVDVNVNYLGRHDTLRNMGYNRAFLTMLGDMLLREVGLGGNLMTTQTANGTPVLRWAGAHTSIPPVDESVGKPSEQPKRKAFFKFYVDPSYLSSLPETLYDISMKGHPSHATELNVMGFPARIKMSNPVPEAEIRKSRLLGERLLTGDLPHIRNLPYTQSLHR